MRCIPTRLATARLNARCIPLASLSELLVHVMHHRVQTRVCVAAVWLTRLNARCICLASLSASLALSSTTSRPPASSMARCDTSGNSGSTCLQGMNTVVRNASAQGRTVILDSVQACAVRLSMHARSHIQCAAARRAPGAFTLHQTGSAAASPHNPPATRFSPIIPLPAALSVLSVRPTHLTPFTPLHALHPLDALLQHPQAGGQRGGRQAGSQLLRLVHQAAEGLRGAGGQGREG